MDREVSGRGEPPRTRALAVDGGELALLERGDPAGPLVLAVHGITASSRAWLALARLLPQVRLLAPDLRGRGDSAALPGPWGLRRHAGDLRRVLDQALAPGRGPGSRAVVVGHSMGAFAAVLLAAAEPERVGALVLVDGGLPLAPPPGADPDALLAPVVARLTRVVADAGEVEEFWRAHPAFAGAWADEAAAEDLAAYAAHDVGPVPGGLRPRARPEAVAADQRELFGPDWYREALAALAARRVPVCVLRAPLGLAAEPPGLYPPGALEGWRDLVPQLRLVEVPDVNHYTVLMTRPGADRVAAAVREALAAVG